MPISYPCEPIINVGVLLSDTIEFELKGTFFSGNQVISPGSYRVSIAENGLLKGIAENREELVLVPENPTSTFNLKKVCIGIGFHWEQEEDQEFEGGLSFQIENNKVRAVNNVLLETYLKSVISSEMSAMNDPTLLKAHAIVSRSWLLAQIKNTKIEKELLHASTFTENEILKWYDREDHATFDVCADDHCQRYQGISKVISENAAAAVSATRGMVLTFDNEVCDARYSKCCGGISESFENVWQTVKVPYLNAIADSKYQEITHPTDFHQFITTSPDAFCNTSDPEILSQVLINFDRATTNFYRWTVKFNQEDISSLLAKKSAFVFGDILDLVPLERGPSGRIVRLKIIGSKRSIVVGKELEIRKWLSESHLYSSAFIVEKIVKEDGEVPSGFVLRGAGWGHGVGMCQIGAAVMSRKGYTVEEILKHYFRGVEVEAIY